jgi:hypothetical protein
MEVYVCPGCGKPVTEGERYLLAQEYELVRGFSVRERMITRDGLARRELRRFHPAHFTDRIENRVYELEELPSPRADASSLEDWENEGGASQ